MSVTKRILLIGNKADMALKFRLEMIQSWRDLNHEVHVAAPNMTDSVTADALHALGVKTHDFALNRVGQNPRQELRALLSLLRLIARVQPSHMLCYTIKPVIYGMLGGWLLRVPSRFSMVTGLGYTFAQPPQSKREAKVRKIMQRLYKAALTRATGVFYQNPDDLAVLEASGLMPARTPRFRIHGSGVNLDRFRPAAYPDRLTFVMVARFLRDKGVVEYVDAARIVHKTHPKARFVLVGGPDENPEAVSADIIATWPPLIEMPGWLDDVRETLKEASVFVLPSYREGTPKSTLEAMAMARPVVTTDAPGCRETVVEGENGYLVPVGDAQALAQAMLKFADDPARVAHMGAGSLAMARDLFDVNKVNGVINAAMGIDTNAPC